MSRGFRDIGRGTESSPPSGGTGFDETLPRDSAASVASSSEVERRLTDGDVLGGRYRVVRFIARGGMGEVYEVEDLVMHERIALKTIRTGREDATLEAQFRREILLSRQVTHRGVCRIFDVGRHVAPEGDVVFLTMELLAGETLHARLARLGRLDFDLAERFVRHLCAALSVAHDAGIVHRDIKSSNVLLVPDEDGERAVITDFGLARGVTADSGVTHSGGNFVVGTPAYMAPEQVEGGPITPRTDLYALGVVMFEMVTGELPFSGASALSIAAKRLTTAPPSPKQRRPELPARWERAILTCLERDPKHRPGSAREVPALVEHEPAASLRFEKLHRRRPWIRPLVALTALVVTVLVAQVVRRERHSTLSALLEERGVVMADFTVEGSPSGDGVFLRTALRERLLGYLPIVDSPIRMGSAATPITFGVTKARFHEEPLVLDGVVRSDGLTVSRVVELQLRIVDPHTHRELWSRVERGPRDEFDAVLGRAETALLATAHVSPPPFVSATPAARAAIVRANDKALRYEVSDAIEIVERAILAEPNVAELRLALADAWSTLPAREMSSVIAGDLPARGPFANPVVQLRIANLVSDEDSLVLTNLRKLAEIEPDNAAHRMSIAGQLARVGRHDDAIQLLRETENAVPTQAAKLAFRLQRLSYELIYRPAAVDELPSITAEAAAAGLPGLELLANELVCSIALNAGNTTPSCDAARAEAVAQRNVESLAEIRAAEFASAARLYAIGERADDLRVFAEQVGSWDLILSAQLIEANLIEDDLPATIALEKEALELARQHVAYLPIRQALLDLGRTSQEAGDFDASSAYYREAVEILRDARLDDVVRYALLDVARVDLDRGAAASAWQTMQRITPPAKTDPGHESYHYRDRASLVAAELGRTAEADAQLELVVKDPVAKDAWGRSAPYYLRALVAYLRDDPARAGAAAQEGIERAVGDADPMLPKLRILAALGRAARHLSVTDAEVTELSAGAHDHGAKAMLLAVRRLRGDDPNVLLEENEKLARTLRPTERRRALRLRLERVRLLGLLHDARLASERAALVSDAHALGLVLIERLASR